jgi:hypothetical protein
MGALTIIFSVGQKAPSIKLRIQKMLDSIIVTGLGYVKSCRQKCGTKVLSTYVYIITKTTLRVLV